ncbi:MAG: divalent-cation tolerance protein CutA [Filomicrobium sp.]
MNKGAPTLVYTTFPEIASAKRVGGQLVEAGLAACVNIQGGMTSIYRWEGKLETSEEVVMIIKTSSSCTDEVIKTVEQLHPYDTPAVLAWPATGGSDGYVDWIHEMTANGKPS